MAKAGRDTLKGRLKNLERAVHGERDLTSTVIFGWDQYADAFERSAALERQGVPPDEAERRAWEAVGPPRWKVSIQQARAWDAIWTAMAARLAELDSARPQEAAEENRARLARQAARALGRRWWACRPPGVTDEEWRSAKADSASP